jgi:hypothetical protein
MPLRGAKAPDKALYKPILHRLAERDVMPLDATLFLPVQGRFQARSDAKIRALF